MTPVASPSVSLISGILNAAVKKSSAETKDSAINQDGYSVVLDETPIAVVDTLDVQENKPVKESRRGRGLNRRKVTPKAQRLKTSAEELKTRTQFLFENRKSYVTGVWDAHLTPSNLLADCHEREKNATISQAKTTDEIPERCCLQMWPKFYIKPTGNQPSKDTTLALPEVLNLDQSDQARGDVNPLMDSSSSTTVCSMPLMIEIPDLDGSDLEELEAEQLLLQLSQGTKRKVKEIYTSDSDDETLPTASGSSKSSTSVQAKLGLQGSKIIKVGPKLLLDIKKLTPEQLQIVLKNAAENGTMISAYLQLPALIKDIISSKTYCNFGSIAKRADTHQWHLLLNHNLVFNIINATLSETIVVTKNKLSKAGFDLSSDTIRELKAASSL